MSTNTSIGSASVAAILAVIGAVMLLVGGGMFLTNGIASTSAGHASYGPLGLFGSQSYESAHLSAAGIGGGILALVGLSFLLYGLLHLGDSFERGKDRELRREETR